MKNEYLNRAATFTAKNIHNLLKEVGESLVTRDDVDIVETIGIGLSSNLINVCMVDDLFAGNTDEAITLRGEDFAAKEMAILRSVWAQVDAVTTDLENDGDADVIGNTFRMMGTIATLLLGLEDKLFDSDHVEEHKAVNGDD